MADRPLCPNLWPPNRILIRFQSMIGHGFTVPEIVSLEDQAEAAMLPPDPGRLLSGRLSGLLLRGIVKVGPWP
jgi:hypothetical protein